MANQFLLTGSDASRSVVFAGGTSNVMTAAGDLTRNTARDGIHALLAQLAVPFYDPQIHPETHGRDYNYDVDGPAEQAARAASKLTVYELGGGAQGCVTAMEIISDAAAGKNLLVWLNTPAADGKGLAFTPALDLATIADKAALGHAKEYIKNGTNLRKSLKSFLAKYPSVTVVSSEAEALSAIQAQLNS